MNDRIDQLTQNYEKKVSRLTKLDQSSSPRSKDVKGGGHEASELERGSQELKLKAIENEKLQENVNLLLKRLEEKNTREEGMGNQHVVSSRCEWKLFY